MLGFYTVLFFTFEEEKFLDQTTMVTISLGGSFSVRKYLIAKTLTVKTIYFFTRLKSFNLGYLVDEFFTLKCDLEPGWAVFSSSGLDYRACHGLLVD